MHCLGSSILHDGQNVENKNFSVKCCLLAFNIVALGPVVSLELFVSRAYVCTSYHAYHIYQRPVFSSETPYKLHVSVGRFLRFFNQFG